MFRLEMFVDDKNLGEAFKRLAGIARDLKHYYVPNVEKKGNGKAKIVGDVVDLFVKEARKRKLDVLNAADAKQIVETIGMSANSYSHVLRKVMDAGLIAKKKSASGGNQKMTYTLKDK